MSDGSSLKELQELVEQMLNGLLTPDQHQRLEQLLTDDPAAQDAYFARIDLHLALRRALTPSPESIPQIFLNAQPAARLQPASATWNRLAWSGLAWSGLAVAVLALLLIPQWLQQGNTPRPASSDVLVTNLAADPPPQAAEADPMIGARLIQSADAEFLREYVPQVGASLESHHQYVLVKGMLELEFGRGARTILQAPAVFEIINPEQLNLKIGHCSVYAPDGAQGFQVLTPRNRVVDLGTRFSISVNDFGHSELQVVEGAAQVHLQSDDKQVKTLSQGEASRCLGDANGIQEADFDPNTYLRHLPDRVVSYEAAPAENGPGVRDLTSITVQRGGQGYLYPVEELIGIDLLHFRAHSSRASIASDEENLTDVAALLTRDRALNTGLINFDRQKGAPDTTDVPVDYRKLPGLAVRFQRPVRNDPGPDVVLFEIQSVVYPPEGDHFRVSPLAPGEGLRAHLVTKFDITLNSRNAQEVAPFRVFSLNRAARSVEDVLQTAPHSSRGGSMSLPFYALAVGIDLSDLGYAAGAEVDGLFFEDANHDPFIVIDPVFIGGFPSLQESQFLQSPVNR